MGSISPSVVTKNADDESALRVVVTNPSPEDAPGPSNLQLSNNTVGEQLPAGTLIGTLSVDGGTAPLVFSITQDLGAAFQIVSNELQTSRALDFDTEPNLNVTVRCTDGNSKITEQTFNIEVLESGVSFINEKSYQFSGNGYLLFETTAMNLALNHSINTWVKAEQGSSNQNILNGLNGTNSSGVALLLLTDVSINDLRLRYITSDNREKDYFYDFPAGFSESQWHMYTIVRDNTQLDLYIDGILVNPVSTPSDENINNRAANNTELYFGSNGNGSGGYFTGFLDEISYHAITLSSTQIANMYNNRVATDLEVTLGVSDFRNWYRSDNDSLPAITDNKGGINGTSINVSQSNMVPIAFQKTIATEFDLTNYYIHNEIPDFTQAFSIEMWIRRDAAGTEQIWGNRISLGTDGTFGFYGDANANNRLFWEYEGIPGGQAQRCYWQLGAGTFGNYQHIIVTMPANLGGFDINNINLYLNSVSVPRVNQDNDLAALPTTPNQIAIGAGTTGLNPFMGRIAQLTIFNKELSNVEAIELFNSGTPVDVLASSVKDDVTFAWDMGETNQDALMTDRAGGEVAVLLNYDPSQYVSFP